MAESITDRFGFHKQSSGLDAWPGRAGFMAFLQLIEDNAAMFKEGTYAERPAAGENGRFYLVEGGGVLEGILFYDNGTTWSNVMRLNPAAGQPGAETALPIGSNSAESNRGNSYYAAHADHSHPYDFGWVKSRLPFMYGAGIGPGMFASVHADSQDYTTRGLIETGGMDRNLLVIKRAGVYKLSAGLFISGFSDPASSWKNGAIDLCICKNGSTDVANILSSVPVPTFDNSQGGIRRADVTWTARLAVDDFVSTGVYLRANMATSSGIPTTAYTMLHAEFI